MSLMSDRRGLRGYVTARGFGPYVIPVPVQSLALRDYCARKKLLYVLPGNENCFPHSYLVLEGMVADLSGYEGVVMCSMFMLPQRAERRRRLCQRVFDQGCAIHLVIEDMIVTGPQDVDKLEELLVIDRLAAQAPRSVALD
jgi:sporadic carbohydrate cluster protein (TIGR04323 family)